MEKDKSVCYGIRCTSELLYTQGNYPVYNNSKIQRMFRLDYCYVPLF